MVRRLFEIEHAWLQLRRFAGARVGRSSLDYVSVCRLAKLTGLLEDRRAVVNGVRAQHDAEPLLADPPRPAFLTVAQRQAANVPAIATVTLPPRTVRIPRSLLK
jgi:hypothetical protein